MKFLRILRIVLRIVLFILLLVLAINNMQSTEFNFLGIYTLNLPLIIILAIFTAIGALLGLLFGVVNTFNLKSQISKLKKQVNKQEDKNEKVDQIV